VLSPLLGVSVRPWQVFSCLILLGAPALVAVRPTGDSAEYLLAARALATRGAPDLRVEDVTWLRQRERSLVRVARPLIEGMERGALTPLPSLRRTPSGAYYSLHFWFYSLLAAPFLRVTELLGAAPVCALAMVNIVAAAAAVLHLWLHHARSRLALAGGVLFVLSGTTFYLAWTGPEVLTSAAVLSALLFARRGELGRSALAGAVASLQNPSAVFLLLAAAVRAGLHARAFRRRDAALFALAAGLAATPYAFFYTAFHVPSLIARFATDFTLISVERAWSLVFDLNQGLIMGLPGLLVATPIAVGLALAATEEAERRRLTLATAGALALMAAMATPTFAIHNWNSGNSVIVRYGYWLALPLLELLLEAASALRARVRWTVLGTAALLQLAVIGVNGVWGQSYSYVRHTWLAKLVLRHAPGAYNPVPEIFYERSLGWEAPLSPERTVVVWPYKGVPGKLMALSGEPVRSERVCPGGGTIESDHVHPASGGWVYLDAPFRCLNAVGE
jgi:hypothetical protein